MPRSALIVEDNALNCALFTEIMRHAGFSPVCDTSGEEAMRLAVSIRPEVALIDLQLPRTTGQEVIRQLRAEPRTRDLPIIAISAFVRAADGLSALKAGADLFFTKPVNPHRLAAAARKLTENEAVRVA